MHIVTSPCAGRVASTYHVMRLIYLSPDDAYIIRGVRDETMIHQVPFLCWFGCRSPLVGAMVLAGEQAWHQLLCEGDDSSRALGSLIKEGQRGVELLGAPHAVLQGTSFL